MDSPFDASQSSVAVIGAGMAGLTCASRLAASDIPVVVFEKSRGAGGRMSTRRACWQDAAGAPHEAAFDHGTATFSARVPSFRAAVELAVARGWLQAWAPRIASASDQHRQQPDSFQWLPTPGANSWCERLARWLDVRRLHEVSAMAQHARQWWVSLGDGSRHGPYTHVVLAMPPAQAAALLAPHRPDWQQLAATWPVQPCWTLMGISRSAPSTWDTLRPASGPLQLIVRNDAKPGRTAQPGHATWVAQARADWSTAHLEDAPTDVLPALQQALAEQLGHRPDWQATWVHRWRYAHAQRHPQAPRSTHWLDADQGLGVCGDYLGGAGVEGAWLSGQGLAEAMLGTASRPLQGTPPDAFAF